MAHATKKTGFIAFIKEMVFLVSIVFIIRTIGFGLYQVPTGSMETTILVGERFFADKFTILFSPPKRGDVIAFNEPASIYDYSSNPLIYWFQQYVWGPNNLTKRVIGIPGDILKGVIEDDKPVIYLNGKKLDEPYLNKYPIIRVWQDDPEKIARQVESEVVQGIRQGYIDSSKVNEATQILMLRHTVHRSYDPNISYEKQPFYRLSADRIVMGTDGKPIEVLYPATPIIRDQKPLVEDKNYWGENADEFYIELGKNQYWCMGDNRLGSGDSRRFGPVDGSMIHGKILLRIWSMDSDESWWILDLIKHPVDFWSRVRWNRFFQVVR